MSEVAECACQQGLAEAEREAKFWRDFALLARYAVFVEKVVVPQPRPTHADSVPLFPRRPKAEGHL